MDLERMSQTHDIFTYIYIYIYIWVIKGYKSDPTSDKTHLHLEAQVAVTKENVLPPPGWIPMKEVEKLLIRCKTARY